MLSLSVDDAMSPQRLPEAEQCFRQVLVLDKDCMEAREELRSIQIRQLTVMSVILNSYLIILIVCSLPQHSTSLTLNISCCSNVSNQPCDNADNCFTNCMDQMLFHIVFFSCTLHVVF